MEIDDLYIAEDADEQHYAIVGEGKGEGEKFSRNQIFRNVQAVRGKEEYPAAVKALGIKANDNETFSIVEFAVPHNPDETVEIERVWEYSLPDSDHERLDNF
ncbi:hypothetical protein BVU17_17705 (plasmid) [Haloarcula taiwanensis]|uniref:Uncharacterized protein n=1 Tax=Haloarcula taiwanensis TaxID=1932004 RepID=A0A2H5A3T6_9EURY|nr:hypothetical protein [Haloarcula taiwanensis]AUG49419.1 hypothetical protein BVU17_17705 [Haloarcula taiwanensis]